MLSQRDRVRLEHMLEHAREAITLIHGYDAVDYDILWQIITDDLPPLVEALEAILSPEG